MLIKDTIKTKGFYVDDPIVQGDNAVFPVHRSDKGQRARKVLGDE